MEPDGGPPVPGSRGSVDMNVPLLVVERQKRQTLSLLRGYPEMTMISGATI